VSAEDDDGHVIRAVGPGCGALLTRSAMSWADQSGVTNAVGNREADAPEDADIAKERPEARRPTPPT
jgi:hypothetical protein